MESFFASPTLFMQPHPVHAREPPAVPAQRKLIRVTQGRNSHSLVVFCIVF